ncbi:hypothetical protein Pmar_PMAR009528 [Perkinsus marinus ATCC 50983]|uniref:Uncharacterized protein n=1 Tax=Perkinsus marinus (strain ATCC 50983 / TXsc) TaxID=423536 RepID=C5KEF6_PERM5|nr:hypothetical protein Pmar_PMAR009528 [Perkinsus marinus ATCC 50983]EER17094.1 hypothetical protein Pmar_PMAR009528 [Perkinsus marinus ATCC 50983]|eukprot:XP_002785298.1 hypothetical protein Pmar_PMAR009528 [Perkinsus marinus ATCC 50983]
MFERVLFRRNDHDIINTVDDITITTADNRERRNHYLALRFDRSSIMEAAESPFQSGGERSVEPSRGRMTSHWTSGGRGNPVENKD